MKKLLVIILACALCACQTIPMVQPAPGYGADEDAAYPTDWFWL